MNDIKEVVYKFNSKEDMFELLSHCVSKPSRKYMSYMDWRYDFYEELGDPLCLRVWYSKQNSIARNWGGKTSYYTALDYDVVTYRPNGINIVELI